MLLEVEQRGSALKGIDLSPELLMAREVARRFADEELRPKATEVDREGKVSREVIARAAEWDGGGLGYTGYCLIIEELARGCMSTAVIIGGHTALGASAIWLAGSQLQKEKFLKPLARGERIAAFALTEPQAGSDAGAIRTMAHPISNGWCINGQKTFITNGGLADLYVIFARTNEDRGTRGISAFIVEAQYPGLTVGGVEDKMGIRGAHTTDLFFEDLHIPTENLLGEIGDGFSVAMKALEVGKLSVAAICLGVAKEALKLAVQYAHQRVQFGRPIEHQQAVRFMIADMATEIFALESIVYRTAHIADEGLPFGTEATICKLMGSEILDRVVDKAVQIFGGLGYMKECPVERLYRDARITRIFEGTSEIQRLIIAKDILGKVPY
ncbi:MAG: acyl-CoA dehydrogenase family protein [bacterium]